MINKNKKRLLSAFVSVMMMSSVASGSEYLSEKERSEKDKEIAKVIEGNRGVTIDWESAYKGNAYITEFWGDAWEKLTKDYIPIKNSKKFSGHAGTIGKFIRKSDGKTVAVKCIPNPNITGIETAHTQCDSITHEIEFFKKIKDYKDHPGIVNCYDIFSDDNVTYIVQDWLEGQTNYNFATSIKNLSTDEIQAILYMFMKKLFKSNEFFDKINIHYTDFHPKNIMIVPKFPNESSDKEKYKDFDLYVVDFGEYVDIDKNFLSRYDEYKEAMEKNRAVFVMSLPEKFANLFHSTAVELFKSQISIGAFFDTNWKNIPKELKEMCYEFSRRCSMTSFNDQGKKHKI